MRDEAAFVEFAQSARDRLRRTAYLLCGDWDQASDFAQEGLIRVYVRWSRLERNGGEHAYARKAVVSAFLDHVRRRSSTERPQEDDPTRASGEDVATDVATRAALMSRAGASCRRDSGPAWCCATSRTSRSPRPPPAAEVHRGHRQEPDLARPVLAPVHVRGLAVRRAGRRSRLMVNELRELLREQRGHAAARRLRPGRPPARRASRAGCDARPASVVAGAWPASPPSLPSGRDRGSTPAPADLGRRPGVPEPVGPVLRSDRRPAGRRGARLPRADVVHQRGPRRRQRRSSSTASPTTA